MNHHTLQHQQSAPQPADVDVDPKTASASATPPADEPTEDVAVALSKDVVFEILKNQRRRDALRYLKENDGVATLSDMAEYIAARENDTTVEAITSSQRKRVYIGLYQCHLPKMATAGVIEFDKNRGDIGLSPAAAQLETYLAPGAPGAAGRNRSTNRIVLASGLGLGVLAGLAGVPVFTMLPDAGWALVSTTALLALAVYETLSPRP